MLERSYIKEGGGYVGDELKKQGFVLLHSILYSFVFSLLAHTTKD